MYEGWVCLITDGSLWQDQQWHFGREEGFVLGHLAGAQESYAGRN